VLVCWVLIQCKTYKAGGFRPCEFCSLIQGTCTGYADASSCVETCRGCCALFLLALEAGQGGAGWLGVEQGLLTLLARFEDRRRSLVLIMVVLRQYTL